MVQDIFRIADSKTLTSDLLLQYLSKHRQNVNKRYRKLWNAYNNDYPIFHANRKPAWKPDNRTSVNFAKYITDTYMGFFIGIPIKVGCDNQDIEDYITDIDELNDADDINSEIATTTAIFGRAYRIVYVDEDGNIGSTYLDPMESFAIYNESIKPKMRYFVRTYKDTDGIVRGSVSDETKVRYFHIDGGVKWDESYEHGFGAVPCVEFNMNSARRGVFEDVLPLINTYNKAMSEKANDVDYFSEAYLKVLGAKLDEETLKFMRENRVINMSGKSASDVVVDFMSKPSGDESQEHLLDRIERMIFTVSMVCNISDDGFATTSGIALKYKLEPMINLASKHWRKFASGLNNYYQLVCKNPVTPLKSDDWRMLKYTHVLNFPANVAEEAQTAAELTGIVSKETQLSVLSIVDNVDDEINRMRKEEQENETFSTPYAKREDDDGEGINYEQNYDTPQTTGSV